jgi:two-component system cell cycle response regulator
MSTTSSEGSSVLRLRSDPPIAPTPAPVSLPDQARPSEPVSPLAVPVRVILVGRTGLDIALRTDPGIELIRATSAIHAIGELSDPIDNTTPEAVSVVVGPDGDPGERTREFAASLRLLSPSVRVLQAVEGPNSVRWPEYDGVVDMRRPSEELRLIVRGVQPPGDAASAPSAPDAAAAPTPGLTSVWRAASTILDLTDEEMGALTAAGGMEAAAEQPVAPGPPEQTAGAPPAPQAPMTPAAPPTAGPWAEPDDAPLLNALLTGHDLLPRALEAISHQLGVAEVMFVASGDEAVIGADSAQATVEYQGGVLGRLSAAGVESAALEPQARWLAHWLALREQHEQLRRAAFTDDLTGAWNRRYFDRFLDAAIAYATTQRQGVTLLFFDIDDFKRYNDRYGHAAGDEILVETVRLLKSVIRPTDRVCRIGGDEFVVIFHEPAGPRDLGSKPPASVSQIARRFQKQICEHRFPKLADQAPGTLTISGGLATFPWDGRTVEELLRRADELTIQSKRQGKNAITLGPGAERVCGADEQAGGREQ